MSPLSTAVVGAEDVDDLEGFVDERPHRPAVDLPEGGSLEVGGDDGGEGVVVAGADQVVELVLDPPSVGRVLLTDLVNDEEVPSVEQSMEEVHQPADLADGVLVAGLRQSLV